MQDRTICKTTISRPIYNGEVIQYDHETKSGRIQTVHGEEIFFKDSKVELQKGNLVIFNKHPYVKRPDRYYAKNVSKGYLSKDGYVVGDILKSHVHGDLKKELPSIIKRISCNGRGYFYEVLRSDTVGMSACVPIAWNDDIVYAKRIGRDSYSKFVKNRKPIPTEYITIFLKKKDDIYLIRSCFYGESKVNIGFYGIEPTDDERNSFWNDHALVFGSEPIDPTTITTRCPWTGVSEYNLLGSIYKDQLCFQQYRKLSKELIYGADNRRHS